MKSYDSKIHQTFVIFPVILKFIKVEGINETKEASIPEDPGDPPGLTNYQNAVRQEFSFIVGGSSPSNSVTNMASGNELCVDEPVLPLIRRRSSSKTHIRHYRIRLPPSSRRAKRYLPNFRSFVFCVFLMFIDIYYCSIDIKFRVQIVFQ